MPLRQIAQNAGEDGPLIPGRVMDNDDYSWRFYQRVETDRSQTTETSETTELWRSLCRISVLLLAIHVRHARRSRSRGVPLYRQRGLRRAYRDHHDRPAPGR